MGMIFYFLSFLSFGLFRLLPLLLLLFLPCLQVSGAHHDGWTGRWRAVMSTTHSIELGQFQESIGLNESPERALSLSQSKLQSTAFALFLKLQTPHRTLSVQSSIGLEASAGQDLTPRHSRQLPRCFGNRRPTTPLQALLCFLLPLQSS